MAITTTSDQLSEAPSATDGIEAFGRPIPLQVAASSARYAEGSRAISEESGRAARRTIGIRLVKRERVSLTPLFNLVLAVVALAIGVATFACITYLV